MSECKLKMSFGPKLKKQRQQDGINFVQEQRQNESLAQQLLRNLILPEWGEKEVWKLQEKMDQKIMLFVTYTHQWDFYHWDDLPRKKATPTETTFKKYILTDIQRTEVLAMHILKDFLNKNA